MFELPRVEVHSNFESKGINIDIKENNLFPLRHLILDKLENTVIGMIINESTTAFIQRAINNTITQWVNKRFIYRVNFRRWDIMPIIIALDQMGIVWETRMSMEMKDDDKPKTQYSKHSVAAVLLDNDNNLCSELKRSPTHIEWFENYLDTKLFTDAVEKHRNELILKIANIT